MTDEHHDRSAVRKFYGYGRLRFPFSRWWFVAYALVCAATISGGQALGWLLASLGSFVYAAVVGLERYSSWRFWGLVAKTRRIQAWDASNALVRVFERSSLQIEDLRTLNEVYRFQRERDLFQEVSLEERLGEIYNKCIRWFPRIQGAQFRRIPWENGCTELFSNPDGIVAMFLTAAELVVCETQVDSFYFSVKETITRVLVQEIVSVHFTSNHAHFTLPDEQILEIAEQLGFTQSELRDFRVDLALRNSREPRYVQEEIEAWLSITRTDGQSMKWPVFNQIYVGATKDTGRIDDRCNELTEDERTMDRIVNELNRVVVSAKQRLRA